MDVTEARAGGITTLRIVGRVDSSVSMRLERTVLDVVSRDDRIVIDMSDLSYVSSAGLRSFITLAKHAHAKNRTIALSGLHEEVAEIFDLGGLMPLFAVYDTVVAATTAAAAAASSP